MNVHARQIRKPPPSPGAHPPAISPDCEGHWECCNGFPDTTKPPRTRTLPKPVPRQQHSTIQTSLFVCLYLWDTLQSSGFSSNYSFTRLAAQPLVKVCPIHSSVKVSLIVSPLILPW